MAANCQFQHRRQNHSSISVCATCTCTPPPADVCDWTSASARALAETGTYCFAKTCTLHVAALKPLSGDSYVLTVTTAKSYRDNANADYSQRKRMVSAPTEASVWAGGKMLPPSS